MNGKAQRIRVSWMAVALLPLLAGFAVAQNYPASPQTNQPNQQDSSIATPPEPTGEFQPRLEKAKDLIGANVVNAQNERLGTVHDIVLTPNHDAISYVVLSHGGVLGVGDKFFAVPWSQFSFRPPAAADADKDEHILVLSGVSAADLERVPGFDKNNWPATASANWLGTGRGDLTRSPDIDRDADEGRLPDETPSGGSVARAPSGAGTAPAPGTPGYREPVASEPRVDTDESAPGMTRGRGIVPDADRAPVATIEQRRLSKLFGMDIHNPQDDEDLGELDNVMIDLHQGKIAYGVISMRSGFLGLDKKFVAVPWSALDFRGEPGFARLNVDRETLVALAFDEDNFPNLEDMQYSRQLYQRFNATPYWETLGYVPGEAGSRDPAAMRGGGYGATSHLGAGQTIRGTIESIGSYRAEGAAMDGVSLRLKTDAGKTVTVHLAPRSFLDRENITLRTGEQVTVIASPVAAGQDIFAASKLTLNGKTVNLPAKAGKLPEKSGEYRGSHEGHDMDHPEHTNVR
jgi:sporulation protein YlmC with PRC-barrel domain